MVSRDGRPPLGTGTGPFSDNPPPRQITKSGPGFHFKFLPRRHPDPLQVISPSSCLHLETPAFAPGFFCGCQEKMDLPRFDSASLMTKLGPYAHKLQVLLVSVDPERDTPDILKSNLEQFDPHEKDAVALKKLLKLLQPYARLVITFMNFPICLGDIQSKYSVDRFSPIIFA